MSAQRRTVRQQLLQLGNYFPFEAKDTKKPEDVTAH